MQSHATTSPVTCLYEEQAAAAAPAPRWANRSRTLYCVCRHCLVEHRYDAPASHAAQRDVRAQLAEAALAHQQQCELERSGGHELLAAARRLCPDLRVTEELWEAHGWRAEAWSAAHGVCLGAFADSRATAIQDAVTGVLCTAQLAPWPTQYCAASSRTLGTDTLDDVTAPAPLYAAAPDRKRGSM